MIVGCARRIGKQRSRTQTRTKLAIVGRGRCAMTGHFHWDIQLASRSLLMSLQGKEGAKWRSVTEHRRRTRTKVAIVGRGWSARTGHFHQNIQLASRLRFRSLQGKEGKGCWDERRKGHWERKRIRVMVVNMEWVI
jgi:hypothetical protein